MPSDPRRTSGRAQSCRSTGLRITQLVGAAALTAVSTLLVTAIYQAWAERRDRGRFPPPGRLVDVGGRCVHVVTAGSGSPAAIVIPALGTVSLEWLPLLRILSETTQVLTYDRAGLGWSDRVWTPRSPARMAAEVHAALESAAIPPPYVIVGHSIGGVIARQFAIRYRRDMAGMVLVDSSHEAQYDRLPDRGRRDLLIRALGRLVRPLGIRRLLMDAGVLASPMGEVSAFYPEDVAEAVAAVGPLSSKHRHAVVQELLMFAALRRPLSGGSLSDLPLTVISSGPLDPRIDPESAIGRRRARTHDCWVALQEELAALPDVAST